MIRRLIRRMFIISLLMILYNQLFIFIKNKNSLKQYQLSVFPEIVSFENNLNLSINNFNEFYKINSENKLIEENVKFDLNKNPDISVIMTIHNEDHILHKGIRSIQNQSLKNIEIIIVDDCSEDYSLQKIKEYQKEDPRIILISHESNEGAIKSRSDGIRIAKGKYITSIDGDDCFAHKDILKNSLFIAEKANLDAVEFPGARFYNGSIRNIIYDYKSYIKHIIYQPELIKLIGYSRVIWGKLIKNELFKKILKYIGPEYTDDYINYAEDAIMSSSLFYLANSYYIMKEIGYNYTSLKRKKMRYIKSKKCKDNGKIKEDFGRFKFVKFIMNKSNNLQIEKYIAFSEITQIDHHYNFKNKNIYVTIINIYDKLLEWGNLNIKQKKYINILKKRAVQKINMTFTK